VPDHKLCQIIFRAGMVYDLARFLTWHDFCLGGRGIEGGELARFLRYHPCALPPLTPGRCPSRVGRMEMIR